MSSITGRCETENMGVNREAQRKATHNEGIYSILVGS